MHNFLLKIGTIIGKGRLFKFLFNISPMYRSTGGRLIKVSDSLQFVKLKLPLNYKTKNYVGTLYGGHMYSCVDGIYMVQLINILGDKYVVWDKSATIKFKRPGNTTLFAEFNITDDFITQIKKNIIKHQEKDYHLMVSLKDKEGKVYAEIEKIIYIASKEFYKNKRIKKQLQKQTN
jgi:hypothetical protein